MKGNGLFIASLLSLLLLCILSNSIVAVADPIFHGFIYPVGDPTIRPPAPGNGYSITQEFNTSVDEGFWSGGKYYYGHTGVDLANGQSGGNVRAVAAGVVVDRKDNVNGWGYMIRIKHVRPGGEIVYSQYGHMLSDLRVDIDDNVSKGQVIGRVGSTGFSTNPHLHFEIKKPNTAGPGYACVVNDPSDPCPNHEIINSYFNPLEFVAEHFLIPLTGDWDGDFLTTKGTFSPRGSTFSLDNGVTQEFGFFNDIPIIGDWNGNGRDTIGVFRPKEPESQLTTFFLDFNNDGDADKTIYFGEPTDSPIIGD